MTRTRLILRTFLILSLLSLSSCGHGGPIPTWQGKLFAGDSKRGGITRAQEGEHIPATDPKFDQYLAMTYDDFRAFYSAYVLGCKEWKEGVKMMEAEEAFKRFQLAMTDYEREAAAKALKKRRRRR